MIVDITKTIRKEILGKKAGFPTQASGYREELIKTLSEKYPEHEKFVVDTIYKELRGAEEAEYVATPGSTYAPKVFARYGESQFDKDVKQFFEDVGMTIPTAEDEASIQQKIQQQMQGYIDAINKTYAGLIAKEEERGVHRLGETRAIISRGGIMTSPRGKAAMERTREYTKGEVEALEQEKLTKIQSVFAGISQRSDAAIAAKRSEAIQAKGQYLDYLKGVRGESRENIKILAGSGLSYADLKNAMYEDGEAGDVYTQLLEETGYSAFQFGAVYNLSLPKEEQIDWQYNFTKGPEGKNKVVAYGVDPNTGKLVSETHDIDFELPEDPDKWNFMIAPNGTPLFWSKEGGLKIAEGFKEGEFAKPEEFGEPTETQKAAVKKWITQHGGEEDLKKAQEDLDFFYWVLDQAKEGGDEF